jgi:LacI family transcriptional regulator
MMSTIGDVAKRAGVSRMTVSRVINNSSYISPETRERVLQAIAELGYIPNTLARSLRFKQTKTIALVLADITNPFFTTITRGVEDTASEQGFSVMFCNTDESQSEELGYLNVLLQRQVDGVLLVPASHTLESISFVQDRGTPVVLLDRHIANARVDSVRGDSEQGAYEAVCYLLELGHRRIALVNGPQTISTATDRTAGYRRALMEAGLDGSAARIYYGEFTSEGGYRTAKQALAIRPLPTALFAANNFIALGAYQAIREIGLRVPEDISIVAFDDLPLTMEPFLTVVAQPAYEIGQRATELLLARLAGDGPTEPQEIVLPTHMIIRRSSGPPSAHQS